MAKHCLNCRGTKKVVGLGWMESECPQCEGTGLYRDVVKMNVEADVQVTELECGDNSKSATVVKNEFVAPSKKLPPMQKRA